MQGPRGYRGYRGLDGPPGPLGADGPPGPEGADGVNGTAGPAGLTGPEGPEGPAGPVGPKGDVDVGDNGPRGFPGIDGNPAPSGGSIFTRWGKSSCPETEGTELLYTGITGGSYANHKGGGGNFLCLPNNPEYSTNISYRSGAQGYSNIYGTQYNHPIVGTVGGSIP